MRRTRLNLAALRKSILPRLARSATTSGRLLASGEDLTLSRRHMLGLASVAALGASPALETASLGSFSKTGNESRLAFRLDGRERWVIDCSRFAGSPRLTLTEQKHEMLLELTGARYPGTNLPADFAAEVRQSVVGWRMHIRLELGGFEAEVPFERWLAGSATARSRVYLQGRVLSLDPASGVTASGSAIAEFFPNWELRLQGTRLARLFGLGPDLFSDAINVSLLRPKDPSLVRKPETRRTLVILERGKEKWSLTPEPTRAQTGEFVSQGGAFETIQLETSESKKGLVQQALLAEGNGANSGLAFRPAGDLRGSDGELFSVPLCEARYAVAFDRTGRQTAVVARLEQGPRWAHGEGCSFELDDCPETPAFQLVAFNGQVERFQLSPAVTRVVTPLPGAVVEASPAPPDTRAMFLAGQVNVSKPTLSDRLKTIIKPSVQKKEEEQKKEEQKKEEQKKTDDQRITVRPGIAGQVKVDPQRVGVALQIPEWSVSVLRPRDLLALDFTFINLSLDTSGPQPVLKRASSGKSSYIVVGFPPQHIAEEAFFEEEKPAPLPKEAEPPINARIAGPSRLAFIIPSKVQVIPYTLESLLDWTQFEQSVIPTAAPPPAPPVAATTSQMGLATRALTINENVLQRGEVPTEPKIEVLQKSAQYLKMTPETTAPPPQPAQQRAQTPAAVMQPSVLVAQAVMDMTLREPAPYQTAIEAPYRLILSPNYYAGWAHAASPVEHNNRTELWHTRLGVKKGDGTVDEVSRYYRTLRAVWARDYRPGCLPLQDYSPFKLSSMNVNDRHQVVRLSADFNMTSRGTRYIPRPVQAERFMLTSLGAWMNVRGIWDPPDQVSTQGCPSPVTFDLEQWTHIASMGRDQYVRIVKIGYLFPFGHRAVEVTITERKFQRTPQSKTMAAYLRQQMFIIVREPEKTYPAPGHPNDARKIPFRKVKITTKSTPAIDYPIGILDEEKNKPSIKPTAYWPRVTAADFQFHLIAEDWEGQTIEFTAPLIFIQAGTAAMPAKMQKISLAYDDEPDKTRTTRPMYRQKVAYAPSKKIGDTTFETDAITFTSEPSANPLSLPKGQAPFYPALREAGVRIATVEQITGTPALGRIRLHHTFLQEGFSSNPNKGEVFAELVEKVQMAFGSGGASTDKAGGFVSPSMAISGLSRALGPVGGTLNNMVAGKFDPLDFFKDALGDVTILGGISLWDILEIINDFTGLLDRVPKFVPVRLPDAIEATFNWKPKMKNGPNPSKPIVKFQNVNDAFELAAKLRTPLNGQSPSFEIKAILKNFDVHLIPEVLEVVVLKFKSLSFLAKNLEKPDVSVDFDDFQFAGPLKFIEALRRYLPLDGFKDPPYLDITASGLKLGYTLALPPITCGVFSIQNITLGAAFKLPFFGDPINFRFNFCERHNPFLLTVWLFGGGGFFALELEPQKEGLKLLEGSFEFGATFSLDIGVASGGAHLMAGIYFAVTAQKTQLTGYVRCGGHLSILGIITLSVEFYMELNYESPPTRVWGRATVTVEIEILFFSISVDLTVERTFKGGDSESAFMPVAGDYAPALPVITSVTFEEMMAPEDWESYCLAFA